MGGCDAYEAKLKISEREEYSVLHVNFGNVASHGLP